MGWPDVSVTRPAMTPFVRAADGRTRGPTLIRGHRRRACCQRQHRARETQHSWHDVLNEGEWPRSRKGRQVTIEGRPRL